MKNHYELLGVLPDASRAEIKKAYLTMLKKYHPDVFLGNKKVAEEFSAKINIAYQTLSINEKRFAYDNLVFPDLPKNYHYDADGQRIQNSRQDSKRVVKSKNTSQKPKKVKTIKQKPQKTKIKSRTAKTKSIKPKKSKQKFEVKELSEKQKHNLGKRKLDTYIIIISLALLIIFGYLTYLNLKFN